MSGIARWVLPTAVAGALAFTTPSFGDDLGGAEVDLGNTSTEAQAAEQSDAAVRAATDGDSKSLISISDVQPILQPVSDYTGKFTERTTVTGDWGGWRQKLYDSGVALNASVTQVFGVVGAGGEKTGDTGYNALFDYGLTLDSARLGLWPGGLVVVNAQSAVAAGLPLRDGAVSPSDYNVVFPNFDRPTTELMEYYVIQGLGDTLGIMLGRVNPVVWDRNRFSFDPRTQFLNGAISQQLLVGGLVSFSTYTASFMWEANKYLNILGVSTTRSFDRGSTRPSRTGAHTRSSS